MGRIDRDDDDRHNWIKTAIASVAFAGVLAITNPDDNSFRNFWNNLQRGSALEVASKVLSLSWKRHDCGLFSVTTLKKRITNSSEPTAYLGVLGMWIEVPNFAYYIARNENSTNNFIPKRSTTF